MAGMSRKRKHRLRGEIRLRNKLENAKRKHISTHKVVTIESLAPSREDASNFMRKRLKKQKQRMEVQTKDTMAMFKVSV